MSITAGWAVFGEDGSDEGMNTALETPEDVTAFVDKVAAADPYADSIRLIHNKRPSGMPSRASPITTCSPPWWTGPVTSATRTQTTPKRTRSVFPNRPAASSTTKTSLPGRD